MADVVLTKEAHEQPEAKGHEGAVGVDVVPKVDNHKQLWEEDHVDQIPAQLTVRKQRAGRQAGRWKEGHRAGLLINCGYSEGKVGDKVSTTGRTVND